MEFQTANSVEEGSTVPAIRYASSTPATGSSTATGVPHFTLPTTSSQEAINIGYFDDRGGPLVNTGRMYYPPLRDLPLGILQYPVQFPPSMMLPKPYMVPPMGYPLGLFSNGQSCYPIATAMTPVNVSSPQSSISIPSATSNSVLMSALVNNTNSATPQVLYRNLFHSIHCKFQTDTREWEGCRIYVNDNVGYSGNAKRFKKKPEVGEKALVLECNVLTTNDQPAAQCLSCKDYFETQKYYKANPDCMGRMVLIKNNAPIRVENGQFRILVKMMCCCVHHTVDFFTFQINLLDTDPLKPGNAVFSAKVPLNVKQWRKSNQKKEEYLIVLEAK